MKVDSKIPVIAAVVAALAAAAGIATAVYRHAHR